jgi:hypothetical protein
VVFDGIPHLTAVDLAPDRSLWVAGSFQGEIAVGDASERSGAPDHRQRMFVARFDPDGRLTWLVQPGGDHQGTLHDLAVRRDGSAVAVGTFTGGLSWSGSRSSTPRAVVAAIGPDGGLRWAMERPGRARAVAAHPDDSVTVAGSAADYAIGFVVRHSADGDVVWTRLIDAQRIDAGGVAAVGARAVVVGWFGGKARFGSGRSVTARSAGSRVAANPRDAFFASFDPAGGLEWVRHGGGSTFSEATGVVALEAGAVAVTGHATGVMEIDRFRLDPGLPAGQDQSLFLFRVTAAGEIEWAAFAPGAIGTSITATSSGDLIVGGGAADGARFGGDRPFATQRMPYDHVVVRYRSDGAFDGMQRFASEHSGVINGVKADPSGRIAIGYSGIRVVEGRNPDGVQMRSPAGVYTYPVHNGFVALAGSVQALPQPSGD